jgi:hypothetical protein
MLDGNPPSMFNAVVGSNFHVVCYRIKQPKSARYDGFLWSYYLCMDVTGGGKTLAKPRLIMEMQQGP